MAASADNFSSASGKGPGSHGSFERAGFEGGAGVRHHFLSIGFVLLSFVGMSQMSALPASAQGPSEYEVKAAFLFNFVKFVEWPAGAAGRDPESLRVCVIGKDPFGTGLQEVMKGKSFQGRPFEVHHVSSGQEARSCQVLFISSSEQRNVRSLLRSLGGASVLTVGDAPGDARQGCVIDFLLEDNRVRFEINVKAANLANLKISAKLLSLAKVVGE
jgi:hypothetical protein